MKMVFQIIIFFKSYVKSQYDWYIGSPLLKYVKRYVKSLS